MLICRLCWKRDRREGPRARGVGEGVKEGGDVLVETAPLHSPPAAVASTAGELCQGPARPLLPLTACSPPGDSEGRASSEPTARAPPWPAPSTTRLPRGESRGFSAPCGALPGGKPPHSASERIPFPGDFGWFIQPYWPSHSTHSKPVAGALHSRFLSVCCVLT